MKTLVAIVACLFALAGCGDKSPDNSKPITESEAAESAAHVEPKQPPATEPAKNEQKPGAEQAPEPKKPPEPAKPEVDLDQFAPTLEQVLAWSRMSASRRRLAFVRK